ncbi:MAG: TylF/MycF/NovP-related O-methyltransferase [Candidatus Hodarchaeota archaeon]
MGPKFMNNVRKILSKSLPDNIAIQILFNLPKIETWRRSHKQNYPYFKSYRDALYDYIQREVIKQKSIDYLEFGVWKGASIKYWSELNTHKRSRFYGFDTFTGLPEDWEHFVGKTGQNRFDVGGKAPSISDTRVNFIKGKFQDTLDNFLRSYHPQSQLILNNDSDLYSSTLYTLTACNGIISPGTIIIFDEFSSVLNEFRALQDYCSAYLRKYIIIGAAGIYYDHVAIRITS